MRRPRIADTLKEFGCTASVEDFRSAIAAVKSKHYADWTDEGLIVTRDEAGQSTALIGLRKNKPKSAKVSG